MIKYFLEIKNRVFLLLTTIFSTSLISYLYKETILFLITQPERLILKNSSYSTFYFIFTNVTDVLSVYIQLIIFINFQMLLVFAIYHCFSFLSQAMFRFEYCFLFTILKVSLTVFCFSAIISNFLLIPVTWNFFFSFQKLFSFKSVNLHFEAKLTEYLNFYIFIYYACAVYFQVFTIFFCFLNCVSNKIKIIQKFRKTFYYFFVVFSTLISPPDFINQFFISLFLIFVYEIVIFILVINNNTTN